jgi:hypothetical protein
LYDGEDEALSDDKQQKRHHYCLADLPAERHRLEIETFSVVVVVVVVFCC